MRFTRFTGYVSYFVVSFCLILLASTTTQAAKLANRNLSASVLASYQQGLEETLKRWPSRDGTPPTALKRSSRDLLDRVDEVRSLVGRKDETVSPLTAYRSLRNLYDAHHRLLQAVLDAQMTAYERRREEQRTQADREQGTEEGDKKDIEKIFDVIFGSRGESGKSDSSDSPDQKQPSNAQSKEGPVDDFQRPLMVEQQILHGIVTEVRFQIALSGAKTREARLGLWLNHMNSLLGSYLETLYRDPSLEPLLAGQYRTHLDRLLKLAEQKELEGDDQRSSVREALKRQAQILGGLDHTRSEQAEELRQRIHSFLRR